MIVCPCCHYRRETPPEGFLFDWSTGTVATPLGEAQLTAHQADIFAALAKTPGKTLSDGLILSMVDGSPDPPQEDVIKVHICKMRRKLEPIGVVIETVRGFGYRLRPEVGSIRPSKPHRRTDDSVMQVAG